MTTLAQMKKGDVVEIDGERCTVIREIGECMCGDCVTVKWYADGKDEVLGSVREVKFLGRAFHTLPVGSWFWSDSGDGYFRKVGPKEVGDPNTGRTFEVSPPGLLFGACDPVTAVPLGSLKEGEQFQRMVGNPAVVYTVSGTDGPQVGVTHESGETLSLARDTSVLRLEPEEPEDAPVHTQGPLYLEDLDEGEWFVFTNAPDSEWQKGPALDPQAIYYTLKDRRGPTAPGYHGAEVKRVEKPKGKEGPKKSGWKQWLEAMAVQVVALSVDKGVQATMEDIFNTICRSRPADTFRRGDYVRLPDSTRIWLVSTTLEDGNIRLIHPDQDNASYTTVTPSTELYYCG